MYTRKTNFSLWKYCYDEYLIQLMNIFIERISVIIYPEDIIFDEFAEFIYNTSSGYIINQDIKE